ncbi:MAG: TetR/AcrR family transcriptional regulator [Eubacteriales bacterium]|nr:TetR/AcrR family transcriptional regulator [Eubacteriales bacterium]
MGAVQENKQQKKERLLETAFSLFTSKGMAKTSISDIASAAGVAKGTFYLYFRDKYDLGNKLIARKAASLFHHAISRLEHSNAVSVEDQFIVMIDDLLDQMQANPILLRFINKNLSWGIFQNALQKTEEEENVDYLATFHQLIHADESIEWEEPELMLYTIIELVGSTCHSIILDQNPTDLEHYKPILYRNVRSIMKNHERIK